MVYDRGIKKYNKVPTKILECIEALSAQGISDKVIGEELGKKEGNISVIRHRYGIIKKKYPKVTK